MQYQNISFPGRHPNNWGVEGGMCEEYGPSIFQAGGAGIQNQVVEVVEDAITVNNSFWYDYQFPVHEPQGPFNQNPGNPICKKVWWDDLPETSRNCRKNMDPLPSDIHTSSGHILHSVMNVVDAPSRLTAQTEWSISDQAFSKVTELYGPHDLDLFSFRNNKRLKHYYIWFPDNWVASQNSLLYNCSESAMRTPEDHFDCPAVEDGDAVFGPADIISIPAVAPTGNDGHTRPQKRKISTFEQQTPVSHGMKNQLRVLKEQFLSYTAIETIFSCQRAVKRRSRYHSTQQNFLDWHLRNSQSAAIQAIHLVNYLAHIFKTKKMRSNTVKSYKSAILGLVADPNTVENPSCIKEFLNAINETEIKYIFNPEIDISSIVQKHNEWGETNELDNRKLTTKCCWLLSLRGFLRASDIHRIDDARTTISNGTLK
ncbi:hypothetical protein AYI68_g2901 [Smittium mucronatum]|uniref:Uncharacterized protein n=1 Tax=Smittium mucronatum TaxID=133383 RepID=A0A1R0H1G3_9FUNG|nr:hypothetical protein AYI68_g2901 [Smittium mucronatum]